jgi:cyclophilin family peptidyl-prolyl cis-trans isomerase
MARAEDPDTNGSQLFVCLSREGTARLDNNDAAFAVVPRGLEVVQEIARTPLDAGSPGKDKPLKAPVIISATTVDAPPMKAGSPPMVQELKSGGKGVNPER